MDERLNISTAKPGIEARKEFLIQKTYIRGGTWASAVCCFLFIIFTIVTYALGGDRAPILVQGMALGTALACVGAAIIASTTFMLQVFWAPKLFCQNETCGKFIASSLDAWVCSRCDFQNSGAKRSFLDQCQKCEAPPTGFMCPHCGEVLLLNDGPVNIGVARAVTAITSPQPAEDEESTYKKKIKVQRLKNEYEALTRSEKVDAREQTFRAVATFTNSVERDRTLEKMRRDETKKVENDPSLTAEEKEAEIDIITEAYMHAKEAASK